MFKPLFVAAALGLSGCASQPAADPTAAVPGPPPEPFSATSKKPPGEQVAAIYRYCTTAAQGACPDATIKCDAFRPSYVKSCMLKGNVPADYITAMNR